LFRVVAAVKASTVILTCICHKLSQHANSVWRTAIAFDVCEGAQRSCTRTLFVIRHSLYMFDHIVVYRGNFITCALATLYEAGILLVTSVDLRVSQDVCVSLSA